MVKQILALVLTALLGGNCFGQAQSSKHPTPKEQAGAIAANSAVEVKFLDDSSRRGWISEVSDTGFVLSNEAKGQIGTSPVTFAQVKSVKQVNSVKPGHTARDILLGVGITLGVLIVIGVTVGSRT